MSQTDLSTGVSAAGDVDLHEVTLITATGAEIDIRLYVSELNLYEDMFRTGLAGNLLIIDNANLTQRYGIIGDEYVRIKFFTPSMEGAAIYKTFKVYSITDKIFTNDTAKQSYIMHFCSPEIIVDALSPVYRTFEGKVDVVVKKIFEDYVAVSRTGESKFSTLVILGETQNQVKFTSPGWRPLKCLNWLASKAIGAGYNNPGYLFFESNKNFYFTNVEQIYKTYNDAKTVAQTYVYAPLGHANTDDSLYVSNIDRQYKTVSDFKIIENINILKNSMNGYLANRLFTLDVVTKKYEIYDYDHVKNWGSYYHMEPTPVPLFSIGGIGSLKTAAGHQKVAMQHFGLYTGYRNNVADEAADIVPRRTSTLNELNNFKIEITVPGRTDMEVGSVVKFIYPIATPLDASDKNKLNYDRILTGNYLVTAIRHKVDLQRHGMVLELVKDSFNGNTSI